MNLLRLALSGFRRELLSAEVLTLIIALALGTAAMLSVRLLSERIAAGLARDAATWIGGDFGIAGRTAIDPRWVEEARARGLRATRIVQFPTVLFHGEASQMVELKAVEESYPLHGELLVAPTPTAESRAHQAPERGTAFAEQRLLDALGLEVGDRLELSGVLLQIAGILRAEPDFTGDLFQLAPRLLVRFEDIASSGLLGPGSRAAWRMMVAGENERIASYRAWLEPKLDVHRVLGPGDLKRAARSASERAERFLALAALLAVLFSGVAIALAASQYAACRIEEAAVMRCLGARAEQIKWIHLIKLSALALPACIAGFLLGVALEALLRRTLGELVPAATSGGTLPPMLSALVVALLLLVGFAAPAILGLAKQPPQRVLREQEAAPHLLRHRLMAAAVLAALVLIAHASREPRLAVPVSAALAALLALAAGSGLVLARIAHTLSGLARGACALGLASVGRRPGLLAAQLAGLSLSLFAILLLAVIGPTLLRQWQQALPPDTPNWFLLNIQSDQAEAVAEKLASLGAASISLEPFATGRLLAINGRAPRSEDYPDPRAATWIHGPLNLSWREHFPPANRLLAGRFWQNDGATAEASVEKTWAEIFQTRLGDRYRVAIADREYEFEVTSLRAADWDSFRVNFFILLHPAAVADAPHQWIASFHLPRQRAAELAALAAAFPNLSLIDVTAILERVRDTLARIASAVELVLALGLAAGFVVLLSAYAATRGQRRREATLLRTLGASRRQLALAAAVEYATIGLIAGALATAGAAAAGVLLARSAFSLPSFSVPWSLLALALPGSMLLSVLAGSLALRGILSTPPASLLRQR